MNLFAKEIEMFARFAIFILSMMVVPAIADTNGAYSICMKHQSIMTHSGRPANEPMFESKFQAICIPIVQKHDGLIAAHNSEKMRPTLKI